MLTSTWAASRSVFAALGEVHLYQCRRDASTSRGNRHLSNGGTKPPRRCSLRRWHAELCLTWPISHNTTLLFGNHTAHKLLSHGRLQAHDRPARGRVTTITDSTTRARSFVRAGYRCTPDTSVAEFRPYLTRLHEPDPLSEQATDAPQMRAVTDAPQSLPPYVFFPLAR